jgi:hypothetical protein
MVDIINLSFIKNCKWLVNRKGVMVTFAVCILFMVILQIGMIKIWRYSGEYIIDMKTNYTPDCVYNTLNNFGEYGRGIYSYLNIIDFFFPFIYGLFLCSLIGYIFNMLYPSKNSILKLMFVPFIAGMFDLCENVCIANILHSYPSRIDEIAKLANFFTISKNVFLVISGLIVLFGIITYVRKTTKKISNQS